MYIIKGIIKFATEPNAKLLQVIRSFRAPPDMNGIAATQGNTTANRFANTKNF